MPKRKSFTEKDLIFLNRSGIQNVEQDQSWRESEKTKQEIEHARKWFADCVIPNSKERVKGYKKQERSSYGLKHDAERYGKTYICNGVFILVCSELAEKYNIEQWHYKDSPNTSMKITIKEVSR